MFRRWAAGIWYKTSHEAQGIEATSMKVNHSDSVSDHDLRFLSVTGGFTLTAPSVSQGPAAWAALGSMSDMQNPEPQPDPVINMHIKV